MVDLDRNLSRKCYEWSCRFEMARALRFAEHGGVKEHSTLQEIYLADKAYDQWVDAGAPKAGRLYIGGTR